MSQKLKAVMVAVAALFALATGPARAASNGKLNVRVSPTGIAAITDLAASTGPAAGTVVLTWTEPQRSGTTAPYTYEIKVSSLGQISNNAEFAAAYGLSSFSTTTLPTPGAPGSQASLIVYGLQQGVSHYFAIREVDSSGTPLAGLWLRSVPRGFNLNNGSIPRGVFPPPSGFSVVSGLKRALLSWTDLTASQKGSNFSFYRIFRSTNVSNGYVQVTTTTATSYVDYPLQAGASVYFRIAASEGPAGLDGAYTSAVSALPYALRPQVPFGFQVTPASTTVTLSWAPTVRYTDGQPFASAGAPTPDELTGYRISRSTNACDTVFAAVSTTSVSVTTYTDITGGLAYYYQVAAVNELGYSSDSLKISYFGQQLYNSDDCASLAVIEQSEAYALSKSSNGLGADVLIEVSRRPQDITGSVIQSVDFKPLLDGVTELKNFTLPKPARIQLHYLTNNGAPDGDTRPVGAAAASAGAQTVQGAGIASAGAPQAAAASQLAAYWFNGLEFKKVYGTVDTQSQTVTVESPNFGLYQLHTLLRSDSVVLDASNLASRTITPNGDGKNDMMIFGYDPGPRGTVPEGKIYDLRGSLVASMVQGLVPNTLVWDGRMNGRYVTSGVYVYQIKGEGKSISGTIVVAR